MCICVHISLIPCDVLYMYIMYINVCMFGGNLSILFVFVVVDDGRLCVWECVCGEERGRGEGTTCIVQSRCEGDYGCREKYSVLSTW